MAAWKELHETMTVAEPHPRVVDFVGRFLKAGSRVLDLGCGKGRHALYCAQRGMKVWAVDIESNCLEVLRKETEKAGLADSIDVAQADIKELPYPNDFFDAVITVNVINHGYWRDVQGFFKEITRVLKSGGVLFAVVVPKEFLGNVMGPQTKEVEEGTFIGLDVIDGDVPHHLLTKDEVRKLLKDYETLKLENFEEFSDWIKRDVTHMEIIARKA